MERLSGSRPVCTVHVRDPSLDERVFRYSPCSPQAVSLACSGLSSSSQTTPQIFFFLLSVCLSVVAGGLSSSLPFSSFSLCPSRASLPLSHRQMSLATHRDAPGVLRLHIERAFASRLVHLYTHRPYIYLATRVHVYVPVCTSLGWVCSSCSFSRGERKKAHNQHKSSLSLSSASYRPVDCREGHRLSVRRYAVSHIAYIYIYIMYVSVWLTR